MPILVMGLALAFINTHCKGCFHWELFPFHMERKNISQNQCNVGNKKLLAFVIFCGNFSLNDVVV